LNLTFVELDEQDIPAITAVMARAFDHDSQRHLDVEKGGPDGYDDGRFFRKWVFSFTESRGYKVLLDDQIVGGFVVWLYDHEPNVLGTIFVDPDYQDRGIATRAWSFIEKTHPSPRGWRLGTPGYATKNRYFYEHKCGFRKIQERATPEHGGMSLIYEKRPQTKRVGEADDGIA